MALVGCHRKCSVAVRIAPPLGLPPEADLLLVQDEKLKKQPKGCFSTLMLPLLIKVAFVLLLP